jgi:hypothetical protein
MAMHTITIHRYFGRQKVQGASAPLATETTPHHDTGGVLHIPDGVALIVPLVMLDVLTFWALELMRRNLLLLLSIMVS